MSEPCYEPDLDAYDDAAAHAAEDAYERQYTHDGTPHTTGPSCAHHRTRELTPTLLECRDCGAVLTYH